VSRAISAAAIGLFLLAEPTAVRADNVEVFAGAASGFCQLRLCGRDCGVARVEYRQRVSLSGLLRYRRLRTICATTSAWFGRTSPEKSWDAVYGVTLKHVWNDVGSASMPPIRAFRRTIPRISGRSSKRSFRVSFGRRNGGGPGAQIGWDYYGTRLYDYDWYIDVTHAVSSSWRLGAVSRLRRKSQLSFLNQVGPLAVVTFGPRSGVAAHGRRSLAVGIYDRGPTAARPFSGVSEASV